MTVQQLLYTGINMLAPASESAAHDARILLSHVLGKDEIYLSIHRDAELDLEAEQAYFHLLTRRAASEPVAYITGVKEFMSLDFKVNPSVLIPRPDTETLVEYAISTIGTNRLSTVLDLCCGSGCIGISIAHYAENVSCVCVDLSEQAIETTAENIMRHNLTDRVSVLKADVLSEDFWNSNMKYDLIVSNPPYIKRAVINTLAPDVREFEPIMALDGGTDGLVFYRKILSCANRLLTPYGILMLEIGYDQAEDIKALCENFSCEIFKDYGGNDRLAVLRQNICTLQQNDTLNKID